MRLSAVKKSVDVNKSDYDKIRQFTRKDFDENDLYIFSLVLCDNDVDRDFEKFSVSALNELSALFVGKTGIFDHSMKSNDQTARIFDTWIETKTQKTADGEGLVCLKAKAYMVKTAENESLIREIDAGIKKEVSVSCTVNKAICSVCGADKKSEMCQHINGRMYGKKMAYTVLSDVVDAYEWSFVAVPAQRGAGVTKSFNIREDKRSMNDVIKILQQGDAEKITDEDIKSIKNYITDLEQEATLGREYKESLVKEVGALCTTEFPEIDQKTFVGVANVMTTKELRCFKNAFAKRKASRKAVPQLVKAENTNTNSNKEYLI